MATRREAPSAARGVAFAVIRGTFEEGAWTDRAFAAAAERAELEPRERGQAQRLAYGAVQRRGTTDHLVERLANRPVEGLDPPVRAALRLGVYELLFAERTPDHAAVSEAVELAKGALPRARARAGAGFVNAVLRRVASEGGALLDALGEETAHDAALFHSYPAWIAESLWRELGPAGARSLMAAMNRPAESAYRVNLLRAAPEETLARLRDAGEKLTRPGGPALLAPPEVLVLDGRPGAALRAAVAEGLVVPQARSSQAAVAALEPRPGERILDLCAAPGGKASAIAARLQDRGEVVAVELDPGRAERLRTLCAGLGARSVRVVEGDARSAEVGAGYDRVLVDPPCSDLGTLASRPDARWRKSPEAVSRLAALQGEILERAAALVRPGGVVVYGTCTVSRAENETVAAQAASRIPGLAADDLGAESPELVSPHDSRFLQIRPDRDGTDGFFLARFRRSDGG